MGQAINSQYDDFILLLLTKNYLLLPVMFLLEASRFKNMFYSVTTGEWTNRMLFPKPITTLGNEGAQSISADGKTMVYTACGMVMKGSCDIYITCAGNHG